MRLLIYRSLLLLLGCSFYCSLYADRGYGSLNTFLSVSKGTFVFKIAANDILRMEHPEFKRGDYENKVNDTNRKEFVKSIKKEYEIDPEGLISLQNEHGKVQVLTWDRNRVKVDVKITVYASSKSAADEVFTRVNVDFSNSMHVVEAVTNITQKESWWGWAWDQTKDKYSIDYKVHLPKTSNLKLYNSYGDVLVAAIEGSAELGLAHGNLTVDGVADDLDLNLSYGTGVIHQSKDAKVSVNFAKLRFKEAKDLELTSSYSKIHIEQAGDIFSKSKNDTYQVGEVREFKNQGKNDNIAINYADKVEVVSQITDVKIERIGSSADLDLNYGEAVFSKVSKGFSELILIGDYVDFKISVEDGTDYRLNASASQAGLQYPKELVILSLKGKKENQDVEGYLGTTQNPKGSIKVKVSNGDCVIDK